MLPDTDADTRSYGIAGIASLCVIAGVAAVRTVLGWVPSEPKGDGMATLFAGLVLPVILSVTPFALLEAGLLVSLVR